MGELLSLDKFKSIIEPFRIKVVEPIRKTSRAERLELLKEAHNNLFNLKSENVMIDLLTDSGTNAMSAEQWAGIMRGDESYAGSPSFLRFEKTIQEITGHKVVIPTHQGRASERIIIQSLTTPGQYVISNTLFDTTRANAEVWGCEVIDLPCVESKDTQSSFEFKGNMNLALFEGKLKELGSKVGLVVMTLTNNSGGGQPADPENVGAVARLCKAHNIPFMIDGCRFAENAYLVKKRNPDSQKFTARQIARKLFELADVISVSAKKDGIANIGGFICVKDDKWVETMRNNLILTEGFPTYGGLSGRDLEAVAIGLNEALDEDYLGYRTRCIEYMCEGLRKLGVPVMEPPGGHAIYVDARKFLDHIEPTKLPGQSLALALYELGGIRTCEIGTVMFGKMNGTELTPHTYDLVRLAIPRRVYTQSHFDYVIEVFERVVERKAELRGLRFSHRPKVLPHFSSHFEWL
ncbi:MAG: tryptophanase [Bdellovibrionota bacterium]